MTKSALQIARGPDNRHRLGIERQQISEIFLVRFHYIGLNGVLLYGNTARHYDKQ